MNAHGVQVFDGADDNAVIVAVAHDFHFELLPANERFLDEDFGCRGKLQSAPGEFIEFLAVVGDSSAGAAESEGRADNERETPDLLLDLPRFFRGVSRAAVGHVQPNG